MTNHITLGTITTKEQHPSTPPTTIQPEPNQPPEEEPVTTYRDRHLAGVHDADKQQEEPEFTADNLPGRHTPLDELATARGVTWSKDNLSVSEKQAELRAALEANTAPANTTSDDLAGLQP
jgi:hypothetical protein